MSPYLSALETPQSKLRYFLVLLVNDSEYNNITGTQPIPCHCGIYFVLSLVRCCCCCGSYLFLLLLLRAPPPRPAPPFWGEGSTKKRKSPVASALALGHVCVGVGEAGVGEVAEC
jgi:hypothetical protein